MQKRPEEYASLREWREDVLGMTQSEVAALVGEEQPWAWSIENGRMPKGFNQEALQKALKAFGLVGNIEALRILTARGAALKQQRKEEKRLQKALQRTAEQEFPLSKYAKAEHRAPVVAFSYSSNPHAPAGTIVRLA